MEGLVGQHMVSIHHLLYCSTLSTPQGVMVGHVSPEAYCGGNIALIHNGDIITIDAVNKTLSVVSTLC